VVLDKEGPPETGEVMDGGPWQGLSLREWLVRIQRYVPAGPGGRVILADGRPIEDLEEPRGQSVVEYALVLTAIAIVAIVLVVFIGPYVVADMGRIGQGL